VPRKARDRAELQSSNFPQSKDFKCHWRAALEEQPDARSRTLQSARRVHTIPTAVLNPNVMEPRKIKYPSYPSKSLDTRGNQEATPPGSAKMAGPSWISSCRR